MAWSEEFVRRALGTSEPAMDPPAAFPSISTDTRTLAPGALFVALEGPRFDGHDHLETARDRGATAAVVRTGTPPVPGLTLVEVDDPLHALGELARYHRQSITGPVVAVTGSNGKTSTKEMIAAVLRTRYATHQTPANLNNLIGIPLTILGAPADTEALVIEAGASVPGEVGRYREIIEPTVAVITNVGAAHLEGFGSLEGVFREKLALAENVPLVVVGREPPDLSSRATEVAHRVLSAGLEDGDVHPTAVQYDAAGRATVQVDHLRFRLPVSGRHLAANAMLAWAMVRELDLDPLAAAGALEDIRLPSGRGDVFREAGLTIIDDCYNANPESFQAAIGLAGSIQRNGRLVWVVGTMRELGAEAPAYHAAVARELVESGPDLIGAVGDFVAAFEPWADRLGDRLVTAGDVATLGQTLAPMLEPDDTVVLKASRGVALEGILPYLRNRDSFTDG
ncbi:MAG: UDP-N-acetylmuramoyl-tripeptide--D-alanyl-D-alanine ligase [Gemmatimonadales bacterium]